MNSGHLREDAQMCGYGIETVYVGSSGHLRRYKVVDANGRYVPGGLFRTVVEAQAFIRNLRRGF